MVAAVRLDRRLREPTPRVATSFQTRQLDDGFLRVGDDLEQDVGAAGLVEWTPAGQDVAGQLFTGVGHGDGSRPA